MFKVYRLHPLDFLTICFPGTWFAAASCSSRKTALIWFKHVRNGASVGAALLVNALGLKDAFLNKIQFSLPFS